MPRKEGPPIEERMQRARERAEQKELEKAAHLKKLYSSRLYGYTRKCCIAFLWIGQFLLIDWALPYTELKDTINGGYFNATEMNTQRPGGISDRRLSHLFIKTKLGYSFSVDFEGHEIEPAIGDSVILGRSRLLHDLKRMVAPRIKESYFVSSSVTFRYLPFIVIISGLSLTFIFIRNIEVKAFAWICLGSTLLFGTYLLIYIIQCFV